MAGEIVVWPQVVSCILQVIHTFAMCMTMLVVFGGGAVVGFFAWRRERREKYRDTVMAKRIEAYQELGEALYKTSMLIPHEKDGQYCAEWILNRKPADLVQLSNDIGARVAKHVAIISGGAWPEIVEVIRAVLHVPEVTKSKPELEQALSQLVKLRRKALATLRREIGVDKLTAEKEMMQIFGGG